MGAGVYVIHYDGSPVLRRADHSQVVAPGPACPVGDAGHPGVNVPLRSDRTPDDFRGGDALCVRQDLLLADDARRGVRSDAAWRRPDAQRVGRHRHAGGWCTGFPVHRDAQGSQEHRRDRGDPGRPVGLGIG